ncbi:chitinase [Saprolegnia diclina VS20]|uniref:chitinase n=1 Tax=Saprolegnia diclina (strain VS20) TaxID=1156394 RepID=T0QCD6_SAPDV|nr:chitinase [Saprolegnia diclina VS20]EQC32366.1 chitinase [Saprolegnia diclina VS20]|eukprot:XP_008614307.1 chitinase [Saprolegnia diclina VS20]
MHRLLMISLLLQSCVSLSRHPLVGYWHDFTNPAGSTYPLHQISVDWDVILVAFASALGNGSVGLTLDPGAGSEATFIADIAVLRASGKIVALSLGGQNGAVTLGDATETANFVSTTYDILKKYGFDGIDIDLENGVSQGLPIINNLINGVKQLKQKIGDSFYLSMAPEHPYVQGGYVAFSGIWGAYLPIIDGLRNELTQIHVQYYNNGGFVYIDGRTLNEGTVDCLVGGSLMLIEGFQTNYGAGWKFNGLRPDQVSFGVPSGPSSAGRGFVTPETVKRALTCLAQGVGCDTIQPNTTYPTYRGVMTWSINWDSHDGYAFSGANTCVVHSLDFTRIVNRRTNVSCTHHTSTKQ